MLGRDVGVAHRRGFTLGPLDRADERLRRANVGLLVPAELGQPVDRLERPGADRRHVGAKLLQHGDDEAVLLVEQRQQQVRGCHLGVAALGGESLCRGDGLLGFDGKSVRLHVSPPSGCASRGS